MTRLLVSVRDVAEARAALAGGADLIDVKDPARGSLGRADNSIVEQVVRAIAGRRPVSAALGDLPPQPPTVPVPGLAYAKWGLAGCANTGWTERIVAASRMLPPGCRPVVVAYADALEALAPGVQEVCAFAVQQSWPLLVDTFVKNGKSLLHWLTLHTLDHLARRCRSSGIPLALAGSLTMDDVERLVRLEPAWIAVRRAACREGRRDGPVCSERVRALARLLETTAKAHSRPALGLVSDS